MMRVIQLPIIVPCGGSHFMVNIFLRTALGWARIGFAPWIITGTTAVSRPLIYDKKGVESSWHICGREIPGS